MGARKNGLPRLSVLSCAHLILTSACYTGKGPKGYYKIQNVRYLFYVKAHLFSNIKKLLQHCCHLVTIVNIM